MLRTESRPPRPEVTLATTLIRREVSEPPNLRTSEPVVHVEPPTSIINGIHFHAVILQWSYPRGTPLTPSIHLEPHQHAQQPSISIARQPPHPPTPNTHKMSPVIWSNPILYMRWAAREKPAIFWSVVIGSMGPVMAFTVPPIRHRLGDGPRPQIPLTYPSECFQIPRRGGGGSCCWSGGRRRRSMEKKKHGEGLGRGLCESERGLC